MPDNYENPLATYLSTLEPKRRRDIEQLDKLIRVWQPELQVNMWDSMGRRIIGYGQATYRLASGRLGHWFIIGLAAHKSYLSLYIWGISNGQYLTELYGHKLGKVKIGKSCLNFKSSADLDLNVLQEIIQQAVDINNNNNNA